MEEVKPEYSDELGKWYKRVGGVINRGDFFIVDYEDESYGDIVQSELDDFSQYADEDFTSMCVKVVFVDPPEERMMKNVPNIIYLQVGEECERDADFKELDEVSWAPDRIFDTDITYLRESTWLVELDKLKQQIKDQEKTINHMKELLGKK